MVTCEVVLNGRGDEVYRAKAKRTGRELARVAKINIGEWDRGVKKGDDRLVEWRLVEVQIEGESTPRYVCASRVKCAKSAEKTGTLANRTRCSA